MDAAATGRDRIFQMLYSFKVNFIRQMTEELFVVIKPAKQGL